MLTVVLVLALMVLCVLHDLLAVVLMLALMVLDVLHDLLVNPFALIMLLAKGLAWVAVAPNHLVFEMALNRLVVPGMVPVHSIVVDMQWMLQALFVRIGIY